MAGRRGWTLVELLVVLGLGGLCLGFFSPSLFRLKESLALQARARLAAVELRATQARAISRNAEQSCRQFRFAGSGFTPPGGSGTEVLCGRGGGTRKIIVSSAGRVRIE